MDKVVKLDVQTDNKNRGRFARLAVYLNLDRPLISQMFVDGEILHVEYEGLSLLCFACGKYGHAKEICKLAKPSQNLGCLANMTGMPMGESTVLWETFWRVT
ncbi:hypothetical protein J1N35_035196 [Gossypium stocksii]|uniref:CCHC-type domain-containing protein n=1 Tax=Gossypium stocksii TaxID=47602 RepID=A0A9D3UTT4_9ROSI|nr:hypothetical protein J1N35_035196 [Gossypium stocksii]